MAPKRKATAEKVAAEGPARPSKIAKATSGKGSQGNGHPVGQYWLMKSEPDPRYENGYPVHMSFADLKAKPGGVSTWEGVRNYQARNYIRQMRVGDLAFYYHSNCKEPGIVGVVEIVKAPYPDDTQFDPKNPYYDGKATRESPRWDMVNVRYERELPRFVGLAELKTHAGGALKDMVLLSRGRLSVQPVSEEQWQFVHDLANKPVKS